MEPLRSMSVGSLLLTVSSPVVFSAFGGRLSLMVAALSVRAF